ncbi:MAG: hypothetical protein ABI619_00575, partial [Betaproteobacteria bacterium]
MRRRVGQNVEIPEQGPLHRVFEFGEGLVSGNARGMKRRFRGKGFDAGRDTLHPICRAGFELPVNAGFLVTLQLQRLI